MLSKSFKQIELNVYWRSGIALTLSIMLHLFFIGGAEWQMPLPVDEPVLISAELVKLPSVTPPPLTPEAVAKPLPAKPRIKPRQAIDHPQPIQPQSVQPETTPAVPDAEPVAEPTHEHGPVTDTETQPDTTADNQAAPDGAEDQSASVDMLPAPNYVSIDYDVSRGGDNSSIGTTHVSYIAKGDGSYQLRSETAAKGLASLFFTSKLTQTSIGMVTKHGLQPVHFAYEFGSNAEKYQYADFDWEAGRLTMHTSKGDKTVFLPAGTQDLLSFMYQYMFTPPLQQMVLSVTNGKKLSQYGYSFEGETTLSTKLGNLQTVHIAKSSGEGEEKTELWLALDYHYLPVKIRKTEKDGKLYEQIVTRLSTEK
ncbi:MAG: DUF3108 domain-containing protein [Methylophilaceae bacterium]